MFLRMVFDALKFFFLPLWIAVVATSIPRYWRKSDLQVAYQLGVHAGRRKIMSRR